MRALGFFVMLLSWSLSVLAAESAKAPRKAPERGVAQAPVTFEYLGEAVLPGSLEVEGTLVGGLSGLYWKDGRIWMVSDDRGKFGDPRVYTGTLEFAAGVPKIAVTGVTRFGFSSEARKAIPVIDAEALVPWGASWIVSSEGDGNRKPRLGPSFLVFDETFRYLRELPMPVEFVPEKTGRQKKGVHNNFAFEGVALSPDGSRLWAVPERPLVQDVKDESETAPLRMVRLSLPEGKVVDRWDYFLEPRSNTDVGIEVIRGVSDLLAVDAEKIWVLERGLRFAGVNGLVGTGAIYAVETGVAGGLRKTLLLDVEAESKSRRKDKFLRNPEALAWGPTLPDGRRVLILMSDNNLSKKEDTEFLFWAVGAVP